MTHGNVVVESAAALGWIGRIVAILVANGRLPEKASLESKDKV